MCAIRLEAALPTTRTISLYNIHTKETISVQYMTDGRHVPEAMERVNWALRDWRKDAPTKMDPALIDLLWEIHAELGSKEPIHIISGYRSRDTNEQLRKTVGGQASESRHITGQAADVHFPDVPLKKIRYSALVRERGGVGYYPTSALPFVHVDTGNVRHWPRMPRYELALLFPNGQSKHTPADGGPLTREDVQVAQVRFKELASQVAAFHDDRRRPPSPTVLAAATIPAASRPTQPKASEQRIALATPPPATPLSTPVNLPQLVTEPRLVDRPSRLIARPSESDRNRLAELAAAMPPPGLVGQPAPARRPPQALALTSLTGTPPLPAAGVAGHGTKLEPPRVAALGSPKDINALLGLASGFASAPAYDEEHPDEMSYRPFPIAPYLTETASADDPVLARMTHPEVERTLDLLDAAGSAPPMRLRPGQQVVQLMWAQRFKSGTADAGPASPSDAIASRKVRTTGQ
jgi:uncharacterized protein YcbK (DUF882 family)